MLIKRKTTPALLAAARANGARSRGASTPAGKAVSAFAGLRHGLYSCATLLPTESEPAFVALREEFLAELRPRTPEELALVEQIVSARWCLRRARAIELEVIVACVRQLFPNFHVITPALQSIAFRHLAERSHILDHIGRFESRHQLRFFRAYDALLALRKSQLFANSKNAMPPVTSLKTQVEISGTRCLPENLSLSSPS